MLPEWPEPQLPTPSPNANEGGRQKLIVNAEGVASKTGDTRGKFTGSPGPAASFRGHGANKHARKMLTQSLYICVLLFATKKLYIIFHAYDVTMF
jgi:hypothetical protein